MEKRVLLQDPGGAGKGAFICIEHEMMGNSIGSAAVVEATGGNSAQNVPAATANFEQDMAMNN